MAENSLKIDDDYCKSVGDFYKAEGEKFDGYVKRYITILQEIKADAIKRGDVSTALSTFITYAQKLEEQIGEISQNAQKQAKGFIEAVDDADQYLF